MWYYGLIYLCESASKIPSVYITQANYYMHTTAPLYLASQSRSRRLLLVQSRIPFIVINQTANEETYNAKLPFHEIVMHIARAKMEHAVIPQDHLNQSSLQKATQHTYEKSDECFVLTADTLCADNDGVIYGKPVDWEDAKRMLLQWRSGCTVATAFCLDKKMYSDGQWHTKERIERCVTTRISFDIPDEWIDDYLEQTPSLTVAGAMAIEEYGALFVHSIEGSYTNIVGLPLFELRQALSKLGFFSA